MTINSVNHWERYSGEDFLSGLRDRSHARTICRRIIRKLVEAKQVGSVTEVGVGGLNERIAMAPLFESNPHVSYTGTDWTKQFVQNGKVEFPNDKWHVFDIVAGGKMASSDLVYSQHVLEHCPGLNPALTNMLGLADKVLMNIFFIPPNNQPEFIHWQQYPLYHNTYNREHIKKVCEYQGFDCGFIDVDNSDIPDAAEKKEVILVATRKGTLPITEVANLK